MGNIINCIEIANIISEENLNNISLLKEKGIVPNLAIIRFGESPDDISYEKMIIRNCSKYGINYKSFIFSIDVEQSEVIKLVSRLKKSKKFDAIMMFNSLPARLEKIKFLVPIDKDVDCINPNSLISTLSPHQCSFSPCTPEAVVEIIKHLKIELTDKNIVVLGRSLTVGKPLSLMLLNLDGTVTTCHSKTKNIKNIAKNADIIISAIGKPLLIDKDYVKEGAIVIDVGINVDSNGKLCGDVNFNEVLDHVDMITPVPKGVGAITNEILIRHIIEATQKNRL